MSPRIIPAPTRAMKMDRIAEAFGLPDASNITDCTADRFGDGPVEIRVELTRKVDSHTASAILGMEITP